MRTITFSPETYSVIYQGILAAEGFKGAEARMADRVLGKLEDAGEYDPDTKLFGLKGVAVVKFEDTEFDFAVRCMENATWLPRFVRTAVRIMEWFKNTKPDEPVS